MQETCDHCRLCRDVNTCRWATDSLVDQDEAIQGYIVQLPSAERVGEAWSE